MYSGPQGDSGLRPGSALLQACVQPAPGPVAVRQALTSWK